MINYYFDNENPLHPYTISLYANDGTMPPDNALRIKPDTDVKGYHPCEKNGQWVQVEDHRNEVVFDTATKEEVIVDYVGPIKPGFTDKVPLEYSEWKERRQVKGKWVDAGWVVNEELKKEAITRKNQALINYNLSQAEKEISRINLLVKYKKADKSHLKQLETLEQYCADLYLLDSSDISITVPELP